LNNVGTPVLWLGFLGVVVAVVAIDLLVSAGKPVTTRRALAWTLVWVSLSLAFAGVLFSLGGPRAAVPYLTAYVIEYALSVDNLFVFLVIFTYFRVDTTAQHRLLHWGIVGAFCLRGALIALGTTLVAQFEWLLYGFGGFLLWTAYTLLFGSAGEHEVHPENNAVLRAARRLLPVAAAPDGLRFFSRQGGRWLVTPLFLVLLVVETTDVLFALDSIPAVLGISKDPFIVFSSNAAAVLGLRSLFFVISSLMDRFRFLKIGLGVILAFVGGKLILETAFHPWAQAHDTALLVASLGFIALVLVLTVAVSVLVPPRRASPQDPAVAPLVAAPPVAETPAK
jgi:tellurite resistance protein TerC